MPLGDPDPPMPAQPNAPSSSARRPPARRVPAPIQGKIDRIVAPLKRTVRAWAPTAVGAIAEDGRDPFCILVSCLISLRTPDRVTGPAAARLFRLADTAQALARLAAPAIARPIYAAALYRTKARTLREICRTLLNEFGGRVPDPLDDLLPLPLSPFCSHCPNAAECPRVGVARHR